MTENGDGPEEDVHRPPVLPHPVPTAISFDGAVGPEKRFVIMIINTPLGESVFFLEPEIAFLVAKSMRSAAQAVQREPDPIVPMKSKLIVPEN